MLSIFPLTLAFVTASLTHKHTHVRRHSAHISLDMDLLDVKQKPWRSILCKASVGPIDAFTCTFTLDGNYTPTQAQIYIRSCMNALESSHKHRCFSYKQGCFLLFFPFFPPSCHKSCTPNKVIILGLAVPNIINGGGTQVLCHGVVSILTHADIYSQFSPERGGRHYIQMVRPKTVEFLFPAVCH